MTRSQDASPTENDKRHPQWEVTLRADARTREKALTNSVEHSLAQLREARIALARAEEERQRLDDAFSETTSLIEHLNRRVEELSREKTQLSSTLEHLAREGGRAKEEIGRAQARAEGAEADKSALNDLIVWLQARLDEETAKASRSEAMSQRLAKSLSLAEKRIAVFISQRLSWADRLRQVAGIRPSSSAYRQLADWRPVPDADQSNHSPVQEYRMQPTATAEGRNPYLRAGSLPELLSWDGLDFVRCAYVTILGRQPDAHGQRHYAEKLGSGRSKMHILWQLRRSEEGERHDPGIAGLDRALRASARGRLPLIGWMFRIFSSHKIEQAAAGYLASIGTGVSNNAHEQSRPAAPEGQIVPVASVDDQHTPEVHSVNLRAVTPELDHLRKQGPLARLSEDAGRQ
jgi:hypothetical protein